jgi:hypothetical protein
MVFKTKAPTVVRVERLHAQAINRLNRMGAVNVTWRGSFREFGFADK